MDKGFELNLKNVAFKRQKHKTSNSVHNFIVRF